MPAHESSALTKLCIYAKLRLMFAQETDSDKLEAIEASLEHSRLTPELIQEAEKELRGIEACWKPRAYY